MLESQKCCGGSAFAIRHKLDRYDKLRRLTLELLNHTRNADSFESLRRPDVRHLSLLHQDFPIFCVEFWWRDQSLRSQFHRCGGGNRRALERVASRYRYEPYVVLPRSEFKHLRYDSAFTGYGGNKIELIIRLRLMGFSFYVIDRGFVFHHPHPLSKSKVVWWGHPEYREKRKKILQNLISGIQTKLQESNMLDHDPATPCCPQHSWWSA